MPDISMCKSDTCYQRFECYRKMAIPTKDNQDYFAEIPFHSRGCGEFWDYGNRKVRTVEEVEKEEKDVVI